MKWWDWADPAFTLTFAGSLAATAGAVVALAVPVFLYVAARKGQGLVQTILDEQRQILARQRRDQLLVALPVEPDPNLFELLSAETEVYSGVDRRFLMRALRANPLQPLPHTVRSLDEAQDYVRSFPVRYSTKNSLEPFAGLPAFVAGCGREIRGALSSPIVQTLTGPTAVEQQAGHQFYRELITGGAWYLASPLLHAMKHIGWREGGLKLNILTGVLLGCKDLNLDRACPRRLVKPDDMTAFRDSLQLALATPLHGRGLSALDRWPIEGSTEPVSATVAWLILAVGFGCGRDPHIDMRILENLADCVTSIPPGDTGWGRDKDSVKEGLSLIRDKSPALWAQYGSQLESVTGLRLPSR